MIKRLFKVQRNSDGLYSTGGTYPNFNENGKTWSGAGGLKNHITMWAKNGVRNAPPHSKTKEQEKEAILNFLAPYTVVEIEWNVKSSTTASDYKSL